jgi:hypothetical protein
LQAIGFTGYPLIFAFIIVASIINIAIGSASAKWVIMAPIFVPMLMRRCIIRRKRGKNYEVRIKGYELRITSYELLDASEKLRVMLRCPQLQLWEKVE